MSGATMSAGLTGQMLRQCRERRGMPQADFGAEAGYGKAAIGHVETGRRNGDTLRIAGVADDAGVFQAIQADATGGVMADAILTGTKVRLDCLAVATKTLEELREAVTAIEAAIPDLINATSAEDITDTARSRIARVLHEAPEAKTGLGALIRSLFETFDFSPTQLYADHLAELRAKGFVASGTEVARHVHRVRRQSA